jgi:ATP-dependent RNA helicase DHX8/PRP22
MQGASLAKERRELRQQEANEEADAKPRNFNQPWLDPMANSGEKQFASDLRGNAQSARAAATPAWKDANKAVTYGRITSMSIQEQRKSLPIYKLRDQLVKAVKDVSYRKHP